MPQGSGKGETRHCLTGPDANGYLQSAAGAKPAAICKAKLALQPKRLAHSDLKRLV
jgi:hypothetical protein